MLDIDFFKSINDSYGHLVGDEFLIELGVILKNIVGEFGYCGRYGGEEFCGILSTDCEVSSLKILEDLRVAIQNNYVKVSNTQYKNITVSIGYALSSDIEDLDSLFRCADIALYDAKHTGRNKIVKFIKQN